MQIASKNTRIRTASLQDMDTIMALEKDGFEKGIIERRSVFENRIKVFPSGFLLLFAGKRDEIVGYICSEIGHRKDPIVPETFILNHAIQDTHTVSGDELYVSSMTVSPAFRGRGLGRMLFLQCIERSCHSYPAIRSVILIVNESWQHARDIYTTSGFVEQLRIAGFFTPMGKTPQVAIVMRKELVP
jgi:ribosomal-protein-alanine N-acetyltransferase